MIWSSGCSHRTTWNSLRHEIKLLANWRDLRIKMSDFFLIMGLAYLTCLQWPFKVNFLTVHDHSGPFNRGDVDGRTNRRTDGRTLLSTLSPCFAVDNKPCPTFRKKNRHFYLQVSYWCKTNKMWNRKNVTFEWHQSMKETNMEGD